MDRVTKKLVEELNSSLDLTGRESNLFENFVNYSIISSHYSKTFDLSTVQTGGGNDTGIDGIAILVNHQLIDTVDELEEIIANEAPLKVEYIFTQAKSSTSFNGGEIGNFTHGIVDFFAEDPQLVRNSEIIRFAEISNLLIDNSHRMNEAPTCKVYYVTTGRIVEDQNIDSRIESCKLDVLATNIFRDVKFERLGAFEICEKYRKTKDAVTTTINFTSKITLPHIDGVNEAYIGVLPLVEFKKIILDENDKIRSVFDDNVRDFQGANNPVNRKIEETLISDHPDLFSVLNNGITIVGSSLTLVSNSFTIKDYQIVNGCQTSNVLSCYIDNSELENLQVPLKLIITENEDVRKNITIATNSQTAIKLEQLSALTKFLRQLEHYYNALDPGEGKLYFERRTKQYATDSSVQKSRIITIQNQIKSFASMYLQLPHRVTTYYGGIVRQIQKEEQPIFIEGHQLDTYYMSSLAYYRMMNLFSKAVIDIKYKKVKFFLLMVVNHIASDGKRINNYFNSKTRVTRYCNPIIRILLDETESELLFTKATKVIDHSGLDIEDKQAIKNRSATDMIVNILG